MNPLTAEQKGILDEVLKRTYLFFNVENFRDVIYRFVSDYYMRGMDQVGEQADKNFFPNEMQKQFLSETVASLVKDITDQMEKNIRTEIQQGVINQESVEQIGKRIKKILKGRDLTITTKDGQKRVISWKERIKSIARTESRRSMEVGKFEAMRQSELDVRKYVDIVKDSRSSKVCLEMNAKYGDKKKGIAINKEFIVRVHGKEIRAMFPPFHPNCRTEVRYIQKEDMRTPA